jgi:hypothetical protein
MNNGYCLKLSYYDEPDEILFFRDPANAQKYVRDKIMKDVIKHIELFAHNIDYYQDLPLNELFEIVDNQAERLMFFKVSPDEYSIIEIKYEDFPDTTSLLKRLIG